MLMTQHVSAGLARAWRAQAAQQGLPATPASPRDPARSEADGHLMSQQLGASHPADPRPDARTSPCNRAPRGAPGVRRAHARYRSRPRPVRQLRGGAGEEPAGFGPAEKPRHAPPPWGAPQPRGQAPPPAPAPRALTTLRGPGGPRRGWGGAARARSGAARGWGGRGGVRAGGVGGLGARADRAERARKAGPDRAQNPPPPPPLLRRHMMFGHVGSIHEAATRLARA